MKRYELYLVLSCMTLYGSLIIAGEKPERKSGGLDCSAERQRLQEEQRKTAVEAAVAMRNMVYEWPGESSPIYYRHDAIKDQMKPLPR